MEDEKVSKEYKDAYNLAYLDMMHGDGAHMDSLLQLYRDSPTFKNTDTYRGIEAGRKQGQLEAERDRDNQLTEMYRDDLANTYAQNRDEILKRPSKGQNEKAVPQKDQESAEAPGLLPRLTEEQIQELAAHEQEMQDSEARKKIKDSNRKMKIEGAANSDAVERGDFETPEQKERREKIEKFRNKGKGKDHSK